MSVENTLICPEIIRILKGEPGENSIDYISSESKKYVQDSFYDWEAIGELFEPKLLEDSYPTLSYENCILFVKILRPVWVQSYQTFSSVKQNNIELLRYLEWTGSAEIIQTFLNLPASPTSVIEGCLLLTAVTEHALGNVYYTMKTVNPPHLLRDLLNTQELRDVLSPLPIFFLKILMGTPNSVNLRNILWHGFPSPEDIPEYYLAVLVVTLTSLSRILEEKNFNITLREKIVLSEVFFKDKQFEKYCFQSKQVQEIIKESKLIPDTHKVYWEQISKYFDEGQYQPFLVLILPQIELILRLIYAKCNQVNVRAKLDEYYIIVDTIFEETLANGPAVENKIFSHLTPGTLKLLYDLFISPNGPRIRDKVSHGELNFNSVDKDMCSVLFWLSLSLLGNEGNFEHNISSYESRFHCNSVTFDKINGLETCLNEIKCINIPTDLMPVTQWNESNNPASEFSKLKSIEIFLRPKQEGEVITILYKISSRIEESCKNLRNSLETRLSLYADKQLRSKRRKTLVNMLGTLPNIYDTLGVMIRELKRIFFAIQTGDMNWDEHNTRSMLRFLKQWLKCVENLAKYCSISSNEWEKAACICLCYKTNLRNFQINSL